MKLRILMFIFAVALAPLTRIGFTLLFLTQLSSGGFAQTGGVISTVAGNGLAGFSGDGGPATAAQLRGPVGIAFDSAGNLYIADNDNQRIRKVTPAGVISTVAGNGLAGFGGDGGPATAARLQDPQGIAFDSAGNLYIADHYYGHIRKVTPAGVISSVAQIYGACKLAFDKAGNLYVAQAVGWDYSSGVYKITPAGVQSLVAGGIESESPPHDGDQATKVCLGDVLGIAIDPAGDLIIASDAFGLILRVTADGKIHIVAGGGTQTPADGVPALAAQLIGSGLAVDAQGNIYTADIGTPYTYTGAFIHKVTPDGIIRTVAGTRTVGYSGDGGPATSAELNFPCDVALDLSGNLYIADWGNQRIRKVEGLVAVTTYLPQIAVGGGWSTLFTVTNTGSTETSGNLVLTDQQGNPFMVKGQLTDSFGTTQPAHSGSSFALTLPSGATVFLSASALSVGDALKAGWAQLNSSPGSLTPVATFEYAGAAGTQCMVGILQSQPLQFATMPVDNDTSLGRQVAYAIANPSSQTIAVKLTLVGQDGTVVDDQVSVTLGPGQQIARYLWQDLARPNFKGSLVLRAQNGQTFVAVGLLEKQGFYAVIPLIPGKAPGVPD